MTTRLLVFDDDLAVGRLVARVATQLGLEAIAVAEVSGFRQSLRESPPQVIVLDLRLGATDGVEQLRFLADQQYGGALIVMSGFDDRVLATTATLARNLGLNLAAMLPKPFEVEALEGILRSLRAAWQALSPADLLLAIRGDELGLEFQPVVTRRPRALKQLEALVRWDHPTLGLLPLADFLPTAEADAEVVDALTDWAIGAAAEAYLVLRELTVEVPIAINIPAQNLYDLSLPDRITRRLDTAGIPARDICLKLTRTATAPDQARMLDVLSRIRLKGVQLAIDDFGTGYASMKTLRQLPFSIIRVDPSFVADMTTSSDSRAIVKLIIDLAAAMKMESVASGVETEATAELLEQLNVDAMQGPLIARPMPVEAIPAWLAIWLEGAASSTAISTPAAASPGTQRSLGTAAPVRGGPRIQPVTMPGAAPPTIADKMASLARQPESGAGNQHLTPNADASALTTRQLEVMQLLTEGCSVKQIARRLDLGIGTVKVHLSRAYTALGARNKVEAVTRAGLTARTE